MRKLIAALVLSLGLTGAASAQTNFKMPPPAGVVVFGMQVVSSCGGGSLLTTQPAFATMDTTGAICTNASGSSTSYTVNYGAANTTKGTPSGFNDGSNNFQPLIGSATFGQYVEAKAGSHLEALFQAAIPSGTNYIGQIGLNAVASGGWTPTFFIAANTNNATNLKASAGIVHGYQVYGIGSAPAYLKLYDKATAPTCGTDTPVKVVMIPASPTAANGNGAIASIIDSQFSTGIGYCVVTGIANNDNTAPAAATFVVNLDWK